MFRASARYLSGEDICRKRALIAALSILASVVLFPATGFGQSQSAGSIAGVAKDASGGVLPGVTVEASSPALIEKVRAVVTDGQGAYRIVDLRPGDYVVTFALTGFRTLKREGIGLSAGVAVTLNAELPVGSIDETVTVSGQSPLVDVQNSTQHHTISQQLIQQLPTAKNFAQMAVLIPGTGIGTIPFVPSSQDVGGSTGDHVPNLTFHGSAAGDMPQIFDGLRYSSGLGTGGGSPVSGLPTLGPFRNLLLTPRGPAPNPSAVASGSTSSLSRAATSSRATSLATTRTIRCNRITSMLGCERKV